MAHFLSYPHPQQTILIQALQLQPQKLHHKHKVNPILYQLLWQGLTSVLLSHKLPPPEENYQDIYLQIYKSQAIIGWPQLLNGRFTKEWIRAIETQAINSTNFYAKVIQLCWQHVLTLWTEPNHVLHSTAEPYDNSQSSRFIFFHLVINLNI